MKVSAVVLAKNEEKNIVDCLNSLKWCDEIIVVDDNSSDQTKELAKKAGAIVFENSLNNDFSNQRNFGLKKASSDWVLFVDADERIPDALSFEIQNSEFTNLNPYSGFYIKRTDVIWGRQLKFGETGNIKILRLAKKDSGKWKGKVHEKWEVSGRKGVLKNPIIHYPHQSTEEFLKEINFYTDVRAKELYEQGKHVWIYQILFFPFTKFVQNYFFKRGFLDGLPGLIFALSMSLHSFLVRGKLWQLWDRRQ